MMFLTLIFCPCNWQIRQGEKRSSIVYSKLIFWKMCSRCCLFLVLYDTPCLHNLFTDRCSKTKHITQAQNCSLIVIVDALCWSSGMSASVYFCHTCFRCITKGDLAFVVFNVHILSWTMHAQSISVSRVTQSQMEKTVLNCITWSLNKICSPVLLCLLLLKLSQWELINEWLQPY